MGMGGMIGRAEELMEVEEQRRQLVDKRMQKIHKLEQDLAKSWQTLLDGWVGTYGDDIAARCGDAAAEIDAALSSALPVPTNLGPGFCRLPITGSATWKPTVDASRAQADILHSWSSMGGLADCGYDHLFMKNGKPPLRCDLQQGEVFDVRLALPGRVVVSTSPSALGAKRFYETSRQMLGAQHQDFYVVPMDSMLMLNKHTLNQCCPGWLVKVVNVKESTCEIVTPDSPDYEVPSMISTTVKVSIRGEAGDGAGTIAVRVLKINPQYKLPEPPQVQNDTAHEQLSQDQCPRQQDDAEHAGDANPEQPQPSHPIRLSASERAARKRQLVEEVATAALEMAARKHPEPERGANMSDKAWEKMQKAHQRLFKAIVAAEKATLLQQRMSELDVPPQAKKVSVEKPRHKRTFMLTRDAFPEEVSVLREAWAAKKKKMEANSQVLLDMGPDFDKITRAMVSRMLS